MGMIRMITGQEGIIRLWGGLQVWIHWQRNITRYHRIRIVWIKYQNVLAVNELTCWIMQLFKLK